MSALLFHSLDVYVKIIICSISEEDVRCDNII
jgi:hypothetical protein